MATTVLDIIKVSLRYIGIIGANQTPDANKSSDALKSLNGMLERWSIQKLMNYYQTNEEFNLVSSTASYTIGSGGDFDTTRPTDIINAQIRLSDNQDYPMAKLNNQEYQRIYLKSNASNIGRGFYYEQSHPLGVIYIYPTPSENNKIRITSNKQFVAYAAITDNVVLPPGHIEAIEYNLAVKLGMEYQITGKINPLIIQEAKNSKRDLKRVNLRPASRMMYHNIVNRSPRYDIITDERF